AGGGVVHLVLHDGEEALGGLLALAVVHGQGEDLADALVDPRLAGADVADAGQQLVEVVDGTAVPLEPFVVQREALDQVFGQTGRGPLAELGAAVGAHPVADGEDRLQAVVIHVAAHAAGTLPLNYSELPNGSFRFDLTVPVDGGQVLVDGGHRDAVE